MSAIPIVYGPNDTSGITELDFFTRLALSKTEVRSDCITMTVQKPKHTGVSEGTHLAIRFSKSFLYMHVKQMKAFSMKYTLYI